MAKSRSHFYVDTPFDGEPPSQRHSMYVTHAGVDPNPKQDLSSASSSATLPSTAGSVDRLTGLGEKKTPRFFTLKPKTSFSLRPFFSSTSIPSLSPLKKRRKSFEPTTPRQDSYVQTDGDERVFDEVGVQTLNASTVDVPVQTCFREWEEGDIYSYRRPLSAGAYRPIFQRWPSAGYSPRLTPPVDSVLSASAKENSVNAKNYVAPLVSSKLLKYAAPGDSPTSYETVASSSENVNTGETAPSQTISAPDAVPISTTVPVKYFSAKEIISHTQQPPKPLTAILSSVVEEEIQPTTGSDTATEIQNLKSSTPIPAENHVKSINEPGDTISKSVDTEKELGDRSEVSDDHRTTLPFSTERPHSALKIDRTDSPVKHSPKLKTVHFALSESDSTDPCPPKKDNCLEQKNLDKDFEALLRDLDILTDDPNDQTEKVITPPLKFPLNPILESPPIQTLFSANLKSAFDSLNHTVLPSILENVEEISEPSDQPPSNIIDSKSDSCEKTNGASDLIKPAFNSESSPINELEQIKHPTPTPNLDEAQNKLSNDDSLKFTSSTVFTTAKLDLDEQNDGLRGNIYDSVIKENALKTAALPTLPSFFDSVSKCKEFSADTVVNKEIQPSFIDTAVQLESDMDNMLSRSSSRSSMRSSSKLEFLDSAQKFDSCENLEQLEEEIIRSLYSPSEENFLDGETTHQRTPENYEQLENKSGDAVEIRRSILDRLINGEKVEEIVPISTRNLNSPDGINLIPESKITPRQNIKYTATLMKLENHRNESPVETRFLPVQDNYNPSFNAFVTSSNNASHSPLNSENDKFFDSSTCESSVLFYPVKKDIDSTKANSVFLFPENNLSNAGVADNPTIDTCAGSLQVKSAASQLQNAIVGLTSFPSQTAPTKKSENHSSPSDTNSKVCDFSNCLRPSKLQNSPFLDKINSSPMPYRQSPSASPIPPATPANKINRSENAATQQQNPNAQCDYASCLKPSQVQNSIFTAELSEITANKSSSCGSDSLRTNSPLTARTNSPVWAKIYSTGLPGQKVADETEGQPEEETRHKSEITIVLQKTLQGKLNLPKEDDKTFAFPDTPHNVVSNDTDTQSPSIKEEFNSNDSIDTPISTLPLELTNSSNEKPVVPQQDSFVVPPPPPPPPPPLPSKISASLNKNMDLKQASAESNVRNQHSNLINPQDSSTIRSPSKSPVMLELEKRFETPKKNHPEEIHQEKTNRSNSLNLEFLEIEVDDCPVNRSENGSHNSFVNQSSIDAASNKCNGNGGYSPEQKAYGSSSLNDRKENSIINKDQPFTAKTVVTDAPPPPGAILLDRKVTVEGDQVHTDKYYAIPVKEVLKETTTTTRFIPAPPKYEGIGPTEDGVPIGLRNSVKKENMHNWYKTMFKSLHKADSSNDNQEYIIGYHSEPETSKREKAFKKKSATLDSRSGHNNISKNPGNMQGYPPSAKSSIEIYNVRPRLIEDYEPGHSSVTDDEISYGTKRYLPPLNSPKSTYEFKNGYEPENHFIRNLDQPEALSPNEMKIKYKEIQKGGDIPQYGLSKPAPEKPKEPAIGPLPPPPLNYNGPTICQATRPLTLPAIYSNHTENGLCQQSNGPYEIQMRQAIHTELQHRISPTQLPSPPRSVLKSPSRSPDLKIPARALFDFKPETSKEIALRKGDFVLILRQLDKNWYEGECQGTVGIFPISYVEIVPPEHVSPPTKPITEGCGKVLFDFVAQTSIELSVKKSDIVNLLRRVDSNWYEARFNNKKGIIPVSYLQVLQEPTERNTFSPKPCLKSPRSSSGSRESLHKTNSNPSTPYSGSITNNVSFDNNKNKLQTRGKKGSSLIEPVMYKAMYSYNPQNSDELELMEGDTVYVVEMCDDGWYVGTSVRTGVFGIFPGNYVEKVN